MVYFYAYFFIMNNILFKFFCLNISKRSYVSKHLTMSEEKLNQKVMAALAGGRWVVTRRFVDRSHRQVGVHSHLGFHLFILVSIDLHSTLVEWVAHCTKVIRSIQEGDQKGHKYTLFARSALCTGSLSDLYAPGLYRLIWCCFCS